jgi:ribonuclease BN (tRNA processing enzyme)
MDMIKVTILGSGTGYPTLRRSACSVLVKIGTEQLLFDMGVGTIRRLLEAGSSISLITHIFFSHLHPDHTGEFASMLFAMKYPEVYKRRNTFMVIGKGIDAFYSGLKGIYGKWVELDPDILHLIDLDREDKDRLVFPEFEVIIRPMPHIESSIGYRITFNNGKSIVYTGDTDFSEDVIILAKKADLLVTESSLPDELKVDGHLTPSLAGQIAQEADVGRLVLAHMYPECDNVDIESQCRKTWSGQLTIAEDLLEIQI